MPPDTATDMKLIDVRPGGESDPAARDASTLQYRSENVQLRLRIATLEQALEDKARERQSLIRRYERLLAEREPDCQQTDRSSPSGLLVRLSHILGLDY